MKGRLIIFQAHADDHRVLALIESRLKIAAALFLRILQAAEEFGGLMNNIDSVRTPLTSLFLRQDLQVCIKHMIIAQFDHVPQIIPFEVIA